MRNLLIQEIHTLQEDTGIFAEGPFDSWSNLELLEYYGTLRVEEHAIFDDAQENTGETENNQKT